MNGLLVVAYELTDVNPGDAGFGCVPVRIQRTTQSLGSDSE